MLTGEPPFTGATVQQIVARVRSDEPRGIVAQRKRVPRHVEAAVLTALEKLPADRFESAAAFAQALSDPEFRGTPRSQRIVRARGPERQRHRTLVTLLSSATVLLTVAALWGWVWASQPTRAVVRFAMLLPRDVGIATTVPSGNIAVSPDGQVIVFVGNAADGARHLYARRLDDVLPHPLAGTDGATSACFSPDGRWVAFWSGGKLQKVVAEGGLPQALTSVSDFGGGTWTRRDIVVYASGGRLYSIPSTGGTPTLVAAPDRTRGESEYLFPVALPDGDHVLYSIVSRDGPGIGVASLSARKGQALKVAGSMALGAVDGRAIYMARDNAVMAVPFDAATGRVTGIPVQVATGVSVNVTGSSNAALSTSGTLAYRRLSHEARVVLTSGKGPVRVVLPDARAYAFPRFSPDGSRIAVSIDDGTRSDIWLYDLGSRTATRLSLGGSANDRPEWTADGGRVLYRTEVRGQTAIWWRAADLSAPASPLLTSSTRGYFEAVLTPNGRAVAYQVDNNVEARALTGDTTPRIVAATDYIENQARVSPDGRWVAFMTNESGSDQIVVQPMFGPGARVQVSSNGGIEPVWSRDGRHLFYRANRQFVRATVTTAPVFAVTSREVFADDPFLVAAAPHANYDVSPDGESLLVVEAVEDPQIVIVHNWAEEVRARLKGRAARR